MKREDAIVLIRVAGYHDDQRSFMRLYTENRISHKTATEAFTQGQKQKKAGMTCACHECKNNITGTA